jgi:hypothetical protein
VGRIDFEWRPNGFLLDLSPVASLLARFPRALEAAALDAVFALCGRSLAEFDHIDPGTGRLTASREAQFLITSLRRSDSLTIYNIQVDWLGTRPEAEAYVLFRDGNTILRKEARPGTDAPISQHTHLEETRASRVESAPRLGLSFTRYAFECHRRTPTTHPGASAAKAGALTAPLRALQHPLGDARSAAAWAAVVALDRLTGGNGLEPCPLGWALATTLDSGAAARRHRASAYRYALAAEAGCGILQEALWLASALRAVPSGGSSSLTSNA